MKKLILLSFLITFTFILNEIFVFGQVNKLSSNLYTKSVHDEASGLKNNEVDVVKTISADSAIVLPLEMQMLRDFKEQLESESGSDIEDRIDEILNVLNKSTDLFCTADEDYLNDRADELNLHVDALLDKYDDIDNAPQHKIEELQKKEANLRHDFIRAIDNVIKTKGNCAGVLYKELRLGE